MEFPQRYQVDLNMVSVPTLSTKLITWFYAPLKLIEHVFRRFSIRAAIPRICRNFKKTPGIISAILNPPFRVDN